MLKTLPVLLRKEFRQFFASGFLPKLCIMFPLMVMLVMPLVANMEVKNVSVALVDQDHSTLSRDIAQCISASEYTTVADYLSSYQEALELVSEAKADVILEIPYGFERSLLQSISSQAAQGSTLTGSTLTLNLSANAVNASKGALGMQYLQQIIGQAVAEYTSQNRSLAQTALAAKMETASQTGQMSSVPPSMPAVMGSTGVAFKVSTLNMFNPTLNYRYFMIPALMIMLLVMLCGFLPALNIVGEKERGTIEQINVSPISQLTFTLGKVVPYWIIGFVVITIAVIVARLVYGLSPLGNLGLIYLASFLFIIVMSSFAALMANFSDNMQQVMLVMFFIVMLFILMSGLLTPITSMPQWAQNMTYAIPPRYYVDILRAVYLRGASLSDLWAQFSLLGGFAALLTTVAIFTYRKRQ